MSNALSNARLVVRLQALSRLAAAVGIVAGGLVIVGWLFNIAILRSFLPGLATMKFNTALSFVLAGIGLLSLRGQPRLTQAVALIVLLLGLLTLSEYFFGWNLGIDQGLIQDLITSPNTFPGRMSPVTALNFCLIGSSLLLIVRSRSLVQGQSLALVATLIAVVSLAGYLYGVKSLYQISIFASMALHTTITFIIFGLALIFAVPGYGLTAVIVADRAGGLLLRRLLPAAIVISLTLAWLQLKGQQIGLYDTNFGLALFAMSNIVIFTLLIYWTARSLNGLDTERIRVMEALREVNEQLETRVQERTSDINRVNQALSQEIVERIETENALAEERRFLHILMDSIPDTIYFKDMNSRFTRINQAEARLLGVEDPEDVLGKSDADFQDPELVKVFIAEEADIVRSGRPLVNREEYNPTSDGIPRWLSSTKVPIKDKDGHVTGIVGISRDITTSKRATQEAQRLQIALDRMSEGAQIIGFDWRYIYLNDAAARQGIRPKEELIGHTMMEMYRGIEQTPLFDTMQGCMEQRISAHIENQFALPDNTLGWFELSIQPIPEGIFILSTDISGRKQSEKHDLELSKERERVNMLSEFIRDTSHDFRTPLSIIGTSLYLMSKSTDSEKRQRISDKAEHQISRLTQLIDRLLMMARLDGETSFAFQALDINQLIGDFCNSVRFDAKQKGITVYDSIVEGSLMVYADPVELTLAFAEIAKNAVWYTPADGTITVRTSQQNNCAVIEVSDTGIGIPNMNLPHIFQRLYRVDKARSEETGGAGLGLSIAKRIIDLHQGTIDVESIVGEGSLIRVFLPLRQ